MKKTIVIDKPGNYSVELAKDSEEVQILGLFIGKNNDQFIIRTTQRHLAPNTKSDLLIKSVLFDNSKLDYDGLIKIEKEAQGSDAYQRNENLVMNENVRVDTKPELEILANSVRCTHGATVGKIDKEQLFYLKSRGLSKKEAEKLIIEGFFEGVLQRITDHKLQKKVRDKINRKLNYA
ncbi:SufD family Fe-S cluster assembly protein [Candidatus Gottesmanbacteria bacterium]|nr:SufD family Fe-S cluster assembly protein [Candidatus Gottesmanbacteria bacterium]